MLALMLHVLLSGCSLLPVLTSGAKSEFKKVEETQRIGKGKCWKEELVKGAVLPSLVCAHPKGQAEELCPPDGRKRGGSPLAKHPSCCWKPQRQLCRSTATSCAGRLTAVTEDVL